VHNTAETLFQRLEANGLTWRVYYDNASVVPFTGMIHASQLRGRFANFHTLDQFLEDAETGRLPRARHEHDREPCNDRNRPLFETSRAASAPSSASFGSPVHRRG
jgi:hypothetical protein